MQLTNVITVTTEQMGEGAWRELVLFTTQS
jgi:hypothetical protein